jgi:hypothetical protein
MVQGRSEKGKFAAKSEDGRSVRSVRATDATWMQFGDMAEDQGMTRADLLERWVQNPPVSDEPAGAPNLQEAIAILNDALTLKSNAGGKIKDEIRKALELLSSKV